MKLLKTTGWVIGVFLLFACGGLGGTDTGNPVEDITSGELLVGEETENLLFEVGDVSVEVPDESPSDADSSDPLPQNYGPFTEQITYSSCKFVQNCSAEIENFYTINVYECQLILNYSRDFLEFFGVTQGYETLKDVQRDLDSNILAVDLEVFEVCNTDLVNLTCDQLKESYQRYSDEADDYFTSDYLAYLALAELMPDSCQNLFVKSTP